MSEDEARTILMQWIQATLTLMRARDLQTARAASRTIYGMIDGVPLALQTCNFNLPGSREDDQAQVNIPRIQADQMGFDSGDIVHDSPLPKCNVKLLVEFPPPEGPRKSVWERLRENPEEAARIATAYLRASIRLMQGVRDHDIETVLRAATDINTKP